MFSPISIYLSRVFLWILVVFICSEVQSQDRPPYPATKKTPVVDTFHGQIIEDEYRWLEDMYGEEVRSWVAGQNEVSRKHLRKVSRASHAEMHEIVYGVRAKSFVKKGKYYYGYIYKNEFSKPSLFVKRDLGSTRNIIISPEQLGRKKDAHIYSFEVSKDDKHLCFAYSRDDYNNYLLGVCKINGKILDDKIIGVQSPHVVWRGNGFYYKRQQEGEFTLDDVNSEVYYHTLGMNQSDDKLVFKLSAKSDYLLYLNISNDERYLILRVERTSNGLNNYYYIDFNKSENILPLARKIKKELFFIDNYRGLLYFFEHGNSNGQVLFIDPNHPLTWQVVIPEEKELIIKEIIPLIGQIVVLYYGEGQQIIAFYSNTGELVKSVPMDWGYSIEGLSAEKGDSKILYTQSSYFLPSVMYSIDLNTLDKVIVNGATVSYRYSQFIMRRLTFQSFDGEEVTLLVAHKKRLKMNGSNPCLMHAYAGYGIVSYPRFNSQIIHFMNQGGVYVHAMIRGGGSKGESWAKEGRRLNKSNSINDFISAAEYLIQEKITSPEHLAIIGASHGGLLVTSAMVKRPDLFKVVVAQVGIYDMLRFQQFTVGKAKLNLEEFGDVNDLADFNNMCSYSPYHNIDPETNYPTVLIRAGEYDGTAVPLHSYKLAAIMQNNPGQSNPIYLDVEENVGHSGSAVFRESLKSRSEIIGFILHHTK